MRDLSEEMQAYMIYIYTYLSSDEAGVIIKDSIDTKSAEYQAWKNNAISLRDYLYYGIASNWIDTTKLNITSSIPMPTMFSPPWWIMCSRIWPMIRSLQRRFTLPDQ